MYLMIQYVHAHAYGYCALYLINDHNIHEFYNVEYGLTKKPSVEYVVLLFRIRFELRRGI